MPWSCPYLFSPLTVVIIARINWACKWAFPGCNQLVHYSRASRLPWMSWLQNVTWGNVKTVHVVNKEDLNFTFMLPCIVILVDIFLNNQPDSLIIPIFFCYKTLHVSGIFSVLHQEFSTVNSALVSFMQVSDDRFQAESEWNSVPSWLCLAAVIRNLHETYQCRM